jgi:hypothetical protein
MFFDWVSFLAYPNLFGIKGFVVVVEPNFSLLIIVDKKVILRMKKLIISMEKYEYN